MKSKTNKNSALFFKVGLAISLGLSLVAFEWKTYEPVSLLNFESHEFEIDDMELPPITEQFRTPPPPPAVPVIKEVKNEEIVEEKNLEELFKEPEETDKVEIYEPVEEVIEEVVEEAPKVFHIVEQSAEPGKFYKYLKKNLKYPPQAKRLHIEGKVFVSFIVDTDGSITNIELIRGIGGGCDEEAIRILKNSPKWKPAKQRGVPVKQKMTFPIRFSLR